MSGGARVYRSKLREAQTSQTRELIVDALVEQVCEGGQNDLSVAAVAERAGVATRTVYRHFPTREALLEAINERLDQSSAADGLRKVDGLREMIHELFAWFEEHADLVEALHVTNIGREVRAFGRRSRGAKARQFIDVWLEELSEAERDRAFAVFRSMFGSHVWRTMRTELGLSNAQATDAVLWVFDLVEKDLERRLKAARRQRRD